MTPSRCLILLALVAQPAVMQAAETSVAANPIRKVVTMLQNMQKKVKAQGEKETELYDKFMCWCKSGGAALQGSIDDAETKIPRVESNLEEAKESKAQTEADLKKAQTDRDAAKTAMAEATQLREKQAAEFASYKSDSDANIAAIAKAVAALEKGAGGSFLQTGTAKVVRQLAIKLDMVDDDRQELLSFLSGTSEYAPQSGQITGILKTMGDEMSAGLADATATEEKAIQTYDGLMSDKKKEVAALQSSIESKMQKVGDLGVAIAEMENDLEDTEEALAGDKKFLANMDKECATKTSEHEEYQKTHNEEMLALADTIKILNDDDALEMFKKTLPGASSLMQVSVTSVQMRASALALIQEARNAKPGRTSLDFIALALRGKKIGFAKVIQMIDDLTATLKQEQLDDNQKKEYCEAQFDQADDKKKGLERDVSDANNAIEVSKESIATLTEEIAALTAGIKALDNEVADATEQRKEENTEYKDLIASDTTAKEILGFAKNRLNKFYNPKMYKPPAKKELSAEDRIVENMSFMQGSSDVAPPPPPATMGAYKKSSGQSTGVIAMIDLLVKELDVEMQTAKVAEKDAQGDYETMMQDSKDKRAEDSKSLEDKEGAKANAEKVLEENKASLASSTKELGATLQYIASLHAECDWLLQYFDVRKEARTGEIDAMAKAKAVLSGADYSLVQTKRLRAVRRA